MLKRVGVFVVVVLLLAVVVVFGPLLFRRDRVHYRWGGAIGQGVLAEPIGVAYANGRLYVTDAGANRIVVFDTNGTIVARWSGEALALGRPMRVRRGSDGFLYVAEYAADRVSVLDSTGHLVRRIGGTSGKAVGALDAPGGAAARGATVYVTDFYNHRVQAFSPRGVTPIGRFAPLRGGRLQQPHSGLPPQR